MSPVPTDTGESPACPSNIFCTRCRNVGLVSTTRCRYNQTGVVDRVYWCQCCDRVYLVRYDPLIPTLYIKLDYREPRVTKKGDKVPRYNGWRDVK